MGLFFSQRGAGVRVGCCVEWQGQELSLEITTPHDERFLLTVELAVRLGKTLIVKECDRVEPLLYALLRRDLNNEGPKKTVQVCFVGSFRI